MAEFETEARLLLKIYRKTRVSIRCICYGLALSSPFVQRVQKQQASGNPVVLTYTSLAKLVDSLTVKGKLYVDCAMFALVADLVNGNTDTPIGIVWPLPAIPIADIPDHLKRLKTRFPPYQDNALHFYHQLVCIFRNTVTDGEHVNMWLAKDSQTLNYIGIRSSGTIVSMPLSDWVAEWNKGKYQTVIRTM